MSNKLITFKNAKKECERLKKYIELVENYKVDTLDKWIIKQYALTNSIKKIEEIAKEDNILNNGTPLKRDYIINVINGKITDELHRILRLGYRDKIKPNKRKIERIWW